MALVVVSGGLFAVATAAPLEQPAPSATCTPATAIRIVLQNPTPFAELSSGSQITMSGMAYDPAATTGTGIDSVTVFLGAREGGGVFLGQATLGQPNPQSAPVQNAGFTLRTNSFPSGSGQRTIFVYAHSSASNREANLQVPIFLGPAPTAGAGSTSTPTITPTPPTCTPVPSPTNTPAPPPPAATQAAAPAPAAAAPAGPGPAAAAQPTQPVLPTLPPAPLPPAEPPTPRPTSTPFVPRPAATPALVTGPATTTTVAPRGGGIPPELGLPLLAGGAATMLGALVLRRRERRAATRDRDGGPTA
jgi:hypothetical protein